MKKIIFFKILLFIASFGIVIFSLFLFLYINNVLKKEQLVKELANSYSLSFLYSSKDNYTYDSINLNTNSSNLSNSPFVIGLLKIDKLKINYPILSEVSDELLEIAPCRFAGPMPNKAGNLCIAGHNYIDNTFFAKISSLNINDEIIIYDLEGVSVSYFVYDKKEVDSSDLSCTSQSTLGTRKLTLVTCNTFNKKRIIIMAEEK